MMPFCASGSLQAHLLGGGSGLKSYEERLKIARGLAAGLAHLHAKRIFHRDVKPDNVLLTAKLEPRLADFGVSKAIEAGGGAEMATSYATVHQVGTAGYSAPEVQFGKFGPKTDVYAAGVVLLQLATGKPAVMEDMRLIPVPLRDYLLTQHQFPAAADSDQDAEFTAFAQAHSDPRCDWPPRTVAGLLQLGLRCTDPEPHVRPLVVEVERVLDDLFMPDGGVSGFGRRPDLLSSEAALTCTICGEAVRDCVLLPCNHAVGCGPCTRRLERCPLCRAAKEGVRTAQGPVLMTWQGPVERAQGGRGWLTWAPQPPQAAAAALSVDATELAELRAMLAEKRRKEAEEARRRAEEAEVERCAAEKVARRREEMEWGGDPAAIAAWWTAKYKVLTAARSAGTAPSGWVFPPDAFDVTVAPGEGVQAAVDRCPPGGCVLLLPGTHLGPLVLAANKVVHVFGRGCATLQTADVTVLISSAQESTIDKLAIRREAGGSGDCDGVWIRGGRLRMQACDVTSAASGACVMIEGGADPVLASCKCVRA